MAAATDSEHDSTAVKPARTKNRHAVALGRAGGRASMRKLTAKQRQEKGRNAIRARWARRDAKVTPSGSLSPSPRPEPAPEE